MQPRTVAIIRKSSGRPERRIVVAAFLSPTLYTARHTPITCFEWNVTLSLQR